MKALTTAIFGKCAAGTTLHTAIGGRLYKGRAPQNATHPYIVYQVVSDVPDNTFAEHLEDVLLQFSIYSTSSSTSEIEDIFAALKALYDDCTLTVTGGTLLWMRRQNAILNNEEYTTPTGTEYGWAYAVDYSIKLRLT